jgi:acetyl esterase
MTPHSLLDPQLAPLFIDVPTPAFSDETIPIMRQAMAGSPIAKAGVDVKAHHLDRADGTTLRIVVVRPLDATELTPVVVHAHPGGWIFGTPETSGSTLVDMARNSSCAVVSVDYRLAPEYPFPAAHQDVMAALRWVRSAAQDQGFDADRIVLAGESAGANIAAGVALRCRDDGDDHGIVGLSMVYSPLDDRAISRPAHPYAGSIGLSASHIRFAWTSYLRGVETDHVTLYAAPGRAENLTGLPPIFLAVGALDPVVDENLGFAQRLIRDGVPTTLHIFAGAPHGFDRMETAKVTIQLRELRNEHLNRCIAL